MTKQLAMSLFKFWAEGSKSDYDRLLQPSSLRELKPDDNNKKTETLTAL